MTHPRIEKTAFLALLLAALPALAAQAPAWVESEVKAAESDLTALRHKLHAMPELGNQEVKTQAEIVRILKEAGIETVVGEERPYGRTRHSEPREEGHDPSSRRHRRPSDQGTHGASLCESGEGDLLGPRRRGRLPHVRA